MPWATLGLQHFCTKKLRNQCICCDEMGQASNARDAQFYAHNSLIIEIKGILVKLKNVDCVISED